MNVYLPFICSALTMNVYEVVLTIVSIALVFILYYKNKFTYWSSKGIPGPPPSVILGNLAPFFKESWATIYENWNKSYGRVYGIYEQSKPVLVVSDAELIKEILIKKFDVFMNSRAIGGHRFGKLLLVARRGDEWRRVRAIMSPAFTVSKMKAMFPLMQECFQQLDAEMDKVSTTDKPVIIKELYNKLSSTVIARCAFAVEINPFTEPDGPVIKNLIKFTELGLRPVMIFLFPNWFLDLIQYTFPTKESFLYLCELCRSVVRQRRAKGTSGQSYPDLLQLLMDAKMGSSATKESIPDHESHHSVEDTFQIKSDLINKTTAQLDEDEIVTNSSLFFAGGYDTTATSLNFATYCLARYPDVQETLFQEIKVAFEAENNEFNYETLTGINYLDAFVSEVLRFLPPALVPEREAGSDVVLSNGLKIEKGTLIRIPIYTVQHDPEYFPDPHEFKVERFLPENRHKIIPGSYLPFSIGPRNCLGMRFLLMAVKVTLTKLVLKYKFILTEDVLQAEKKFAIAGPLLRLKNDFRVKVELRSSE